MKKRNPMIRALSVVLVLCMVLSMSPAAFAWSFSELFGSRSSSHALSIEKIDGVDANVKLELDPVGIPMRRSDTPRQTMSVCPSF